MKKTYLIAAVAALALVGTILMFTAGSDDKAQTSSAQADKTRATADNKPVAVSQSVSADKPAATKRAAKQSDPVVADSGSRIVHRGPPSKRIFVSRFESQPKIAPATEYRKWTTQQWASKVNTLRQQGKNDLAQQYVVAYEKTYPDKSLDSYLK